MEAVQTDDKVLKPAWIFPDPSEAMLQFWEEKKWNFSELEMHK